MTIIQAIILAIIEGITEFLPVSSTGHMILASAALGLENESFVRTFEISIQLGAIFAIVLLYVRKFLASFKIYITLFIAFVPTAIIGFIAYGFIKSYLFNPLVVAISLIAGGVILILVDNKVVNRDSDYDTIDNLPYKSAFFIGLIQSISMIPGVSRAAATIIGGVFNGLNKKQATEFSFLLAVPTMFAAAGYDLYKSASTITQTNLIILGIGFIVAFLSAFIAVKIFLQLVEKYGFKYFGYYRILVGIIFLTWVVLN